MVFDITLSMESESILATELQDLSQEYGLSSESETAVARPSMTLALISPWISFSEASVRMGK